MKLGTLPILFALTLIASACSKLQIQMSPAQTAGSPPDTHSERVQKEQDHGFEKMIYDSQGALDLSYSISESKEGRVTADVQRYQNSIVKNSPFEIPDGGLKVKIQTLFRGEVEFATDTSNGSSETENESTKKSTVTLTLTATSGKVSVLENPKLITHGYEELLSEITAEVTKSVEQVSPKPIHKSTEKDPISNTVTTSLEASKNNEPVNHESAADPELDALKKRHREVLDQIQQIVPAEKNSYAIVSTPFNPNHEQKKKVIELTQERLCLELQLFRALNHLDFPLDCSNGSNRFPDFVLEVIKDDGKKREPFTDPTLGPMEIERFQSPLKFYILAGDRRVLFKVENRVILQSKAGPKLKEGDMKTPEGTYLLRSGTPESKYFISTHIDYENWSERKTLLSDGVPNRDTRKIGGEIKIHGTGGSDGCLSIPNTEAALVAVWTEGARNRSIEIYPVEMTDEKLSKLVQGPGGSTYADFWKKLQGRYLESKRPEKQLAPGAKTIDELLE
jgi:hypothetical protein